MTNVDFYILASSQPADALIFGCRLAEKAWKKGHRVYLHCRDAAQAGQLDSLLWEFSAESFLPHALKDAASGEAVLLGFDNTPPETPDLLINLCPGIPDFFSRFQRVGEIVCQADDWLAPSRDRYRFYKDRGYPLKTHKIA